MIFFVSFSSQTAKTTTTITKMEHTQARKSLSHGVVNCAASVLDFTTYCMKQEQQISFLSQNTLMIYMVALGDQNTAAYETNQNKTKNTCKDTNMLNASRQNRLKANAKLKAHAIITM